MAEAVILKPGLTAALGGAGASVLNMAGGQRLTDSIRRRWNVIEACETDAAGRLKGAAMAARAALSKVSSRATAEP